MSKDSKFVEYWVPVGFSGVQLEQYCANLFCSYSSLCSPSKIDHVGSLQCVLENARKCCDHPYLVDSSLQKLPHEKGFLEVGINASGKLKLLDSMLSYMKNKGLRVLVLFQNDCGPCNAGDIVDDVIRLRFGSGCYERYQVAVQPSKRQAALNKFNTKEGSFIFLLEVQSCSSKIKLSNIDCVILYGSDWNPMNDMKSLQKILVDTKAEKIHVFRLFSPFTVEEKALILSRENSSLDSKLKNLSVSANHLLLMWGSSILYEQLADFHASKKSENTFCGQFQPENVFQDFSAILDQNGKDFHLNKSSAIVKVEKLGYYVTESKLPGENQGVLRDNEPPHVFWKRLLNGKQPQWRNKFSFTSERKRKRVQLSSLETLTDNELNAKEDGLPTAKRLLESNEGQDKLPSPSIANYSEKVPENKSLYAVQKDLHNRLKPEISNLCEDEIPTEKKLLETNGGQDELPSPSIANNSEKVPQSKCLYELQKDLHNRWKPEISNLCKVLKLPENVKSMVDNFLDYVMANHRMTVESTTIVEAFQISLCWTVAFFMEFDLNHKSSLSLAKQHLNYSCRKDDTEDIFFTLKCLKRVFLSHMLDSAAEGSVFHSELNQKDLLDSIRDIEQKFSKKLGKLSRKKMSERNSILSNYEKEKQKLSNKNRFEELTINVTTSKSSMISFLNEIMEQTYDKTFWDLESEAMNRLKQMEKLHLVAVDRLQNRKRHLIIGLKKWAQLEESSPLSNPKPEIFTFEIGDVLGPSTAESGQQIGSNSADDQRLPNECSGNPQNDFDVGVRPRMELPLDHTNNCNLGLSPADLSQENIIMEDVSNVVNPPNLSSLQRNILSSPESTCVGVTNEASCAVVAPKKEPTLNDFPVTSQVNARSSEARDLPTSGNGINDSPRALSPESICATEEPTNINTSRNLTAFEIIEEAQSVGMNENDTLTSNIAFLEELPNCTVAINEADVDEETCDIIEAISPKDIPLDHQTDTNLEIKTFDAFLYGHSLPRRLASEENLCTPPFELPARLGISINGAENDVSEFHHARKKLHVSPLRIDLDNISKEIERIAISNEDTKMRLKAECEDEVGKIRAKYESMIMEADLQNFAKRKELKIHYQKVKLSMFFADAFRAKTCKRPEIVTRADSVRSWPHDLKRGYSSCVPMNDANVALPVDVGEVVCISDDE